MYRKTNTYIFAIYLCTINPSIRIVLLSTTFKSYIICIIILFDCLFAASIDLLFLYTFGLLHLEYLVLFLGRTTMPICERQCAFCRMCLIVNMIRTTSLYICLSGETAVDVPCQWTLGNCRKWFPIYPRLDQPLNETFLSNGFVPNDSPPDKVRLQTIAIPFTPVPFVAASSIEARRLPPIWRVRKHNTFLPIPPPIEVFHNVVVHKLLYHQSTESTPSRLALLCSPLRC